MGLLQDIMGGATPQDTQLAQESNSFVQAMQNTAGTEYGDLFGTQNDLNNEFNYLMQGGPNKYGFSTAEDQALQAEIENAGGQATENSVAAQQLRQQQASGGASMMPTGANAALELTAREQGAQNIASNLAQEKLAGYQQGEQEYMAGLQGKQNLASLESNTAGTAAGIVPKAEEQALNAQQYVDMQNANSLASKLLGGALGNIGSTITSLTPAKGGGTGTSVLNAIGGLLGG